ncbi:MAG TPA: M20 family peptidase [Desulfobacteraceae bacterium]|nr:M20 family peptidase [Desulfobacteraceae bacterium]
MSQRMNVEIRPDRLKKLFRKLVDIYSPSGKEEEIVEFLSRYLKRAGLPVTLQDVDENRCNILVIPEKADIQAGFVGHLDTVAAHNLETFGFSEEGEVVSGLGTADMKGGCAALIEAFTALWESGCHGLPVALCLLVGEEEEGDGAEALLTEFHFPWAVIAEPTSLKPCLSHYGYAEIQLSTAGERMHASMAKMTDNAVEVMLRLILDISRHIQTERPDLVYNIRDLFSAQSGFAVPERCDASIDLHLPPTAPIGEIITEIEELAADHRYNHEGVETQFRVVTIDAGYDLPERGPLIDALKTAFAAFSIDWEPEAFRSHSDANRFWAAGVKPILLGPGDLVKAHSPDECISFDEIQKAAGLYAGLLGGDFFDHKC